MNKIGLIFPLITLVVGIFILINKDIHGGLLFIIISLLQYIILQNDNKPPNPPHFNVYIDGDELRKAIYDADRIKREQYLN